MFILYYSTSGYTKEYAEMFADKVGLKIYSYEELKDHNPNDKDIIFFSNLRAEKINKYKEVAKKYHVLDMFVCGLDNKVNHRQESLRKKYNNLNIYYGPGGFNKQKLKGFDKHIMKLIVNRMDKNIYENGINLVDAKYLSELYKKYQNKQL